MEAAELDMPLDWLGVGRPAQRALKEAGFTQGEMHVFLTGPGKLKLSPTMPRVNKHLVEQVTTLALVRALRRHRPDVSCFVPHARRAGGPQRRPPVLHACSPSVVCGWRVSPRCRVDGRSLAVRAPTTALTCKSNLGASVMPIPASPSGTCGGRCGSCRTACTR
jgi:hypothetical protein